MHASPTSRPRCEGVFLTDFDHCRLGSQLRQDLPVGGASAAHIYIISLGARSIINLWGS